MSHMDEVVTHLKAMGVTAVAMPMPNKDIVVLILSVEEAEHYEWAVEVQRDCEMFGNSLHSRINGVIQRVDPATWAIRIVEGEQR